ASCTGRTWQPRHGTPEPGSGPPRAVQGAAAPWRPQRPSWDCRRDSSCGLRSVAELQPVEPAPDDVATGKGDGRKDHPNPKGIRWRDVEAKPRQDNKVRREVDSESDRDVGPCLDKRT